MSGPPRFLKWLLFCLVLVSLTAVPVAAQTENEAIRMQVNAGFDGYYKPEFWMPINVTVTNDGPALEGRLRFTSRRFASDEPVIYERPLSLPTRSNKQVVLYIHPDVSLTEPAIELLDENGRVAAAAPTNTLRRLSADVLLYGVVSPAPDEFAFLRDIDGSRRADAETALLTLEQLPPVSAAWSALDLLILHDSDVGQLSAAQGEALRRWVSGGGHLVLAGGAAWQKTTAGLDEMLPVAISGSESMADLPALSADLGEPYRDEGPYLVTTSSLRQGELLLHQDGLPLLARRDWGRGAVYFLALDPALAPLRDWDGNEALWEMVADNVAVYPPWALGFQNGYAAGTAVSSLPSLNLPSTLSLVLFLVVYVAAVGPANYFVLKRIGRRELTWVTIPALVLIFTGATYLVGFQLKGNETVINQMSLVYGRLDDEGDTARMQTLLGLYSPRRRVYDLTVPADVLLRPFNRNSGQLTGGGGAVDAMRQGERIMAHNVRVDVSDVRTFVADTTHPLPPVSGSAILRMENNNLMLEASVQNNGDIPLQTAALLLGEEAFSLGDILPGEGASTTEQVRAGSAAGSGATSGLLYAPSGPPGSNPLLRNASLLLGTSNYYDDPEIYPRWQLLEAFRDNRGGSAGVSLPDGAVTLVAWTDTPQLDVDLAQRPFKSLGTTLYLLEIPLRRELGEGGVTGLPLAFLNWNVLQADGIYEPAVRDLNLYGTAQVAFAYTPWESYQLAQVTGLQIALESSGAAGGIAPRIELWDWEGENWVAQRDVDWGRTAVADYGRYLGPDNTVHLRLSNDGNNPVEIREVYPVLTGTLE